MYFDYKSESVTVPCFSYQKQPSASVNPLNHSIKSIDSVLNNDVDLL